MVLQVGDTFTSMQAACEAIQRYILNDSESYKTKKANKKRYILRYKDINYTFRIQVTNLEKKGPTITVYTLHTCSPTVHYKNKNAHLVKYLIEHHCSLVIDNRHITATQIRSTKRLNFNNDISYKQAYRTIQAILTKMYSDKAKSFAKFLAYVERFQAADPTNYCKIQVHKEIGHFLSVFFAPSGLQHASKFIQEIIRVDSTYTASQFQMNLLIASSVNANGETIPLAQALVLIENGIQWKWFFKHLNKAFEIKSQAGIILILDREKGLLSA